MEQAVADNPDTQAAAEQRREFARFEQPGEVTGTGAGVWRAIDASANRAGEALRVVEDIVRFALDDAHLTGLAKQLRHDLAAVLAEPELALRQAARDVGGDVGAGAEADAALPRATVDDIIAANAARAGQSLRSLQECARMLAPAVAARFEQIRYRLYVLERAALGTARSTERLRGITLCVLLDGRADAQAFERLVESLVEAGVRMFQIRDKDLGLPQLADRVRRAVGITRRQHHGGAGLVVVNDRVDVAVAASADGAHTGADDLPTGLVRRVIGPRGLLGRTAHDLDEARIAVLEGADYLGVGPCFPSSTKSFESFAPAEFLVGVAREIRLPTFAIGGITLDRLEQITALGYRRVAVASAVTSAADPAAAAAAFIERLRPQEPRNPAAS
jgi:thiamine-phosphate pyrophosphorylase